MHFHTLTPTHLYAQTGKYNTVLILHSRFGRSDVATTTTPAPPPGILHAFVCFLTSTGRGLVGVADRNPTPHGGQRDVNDVSEPMPLELSTVGVQVGASENYLRLPLHGGVPVIFYGVVGAARHHLGDLGPLVAQLLVLDENRAILKGEKKNMDQRTKGLVDLSLPLRASPLRAAPPFS